MQVGGGDTRLMTDSFHLVHRGHKGRVTVTVTVVFAPCWSKRQALDRMFVQRG